jgi:L-serine kinase (ADP)
MRSPEFALVPLSELREHEEVEPAAVRALADRIRAEGVVRDPIWIARGSGVILNGHHRFQALSALGAVRAPAWVFDYDDPSVELERWSPGPPVTKAHVLERAVAGVRFPPKTTKHVLRVSLPVRITPLAELMPAAAPHPVGPRPSRTSGRSAPTR